MRKLTRKLLRSFLREKNRIFRKIEAEFWFRLYFSKTFVLTFWGIDGIIKLL